MERPIGLRTRKEHIYPPVYTLWHTSQAGLNGVVTSSAAYMRVEVRLG